MITVNCKYLEVASLTLLIKLQWRNFMNTNISWPGVYFLAALFSLASTSALAQSVLVSAESGGLVPIDGVWEFPGCAKPDPDDPPEEQFDEREFLVFDGNNVESRLILYPSTTGICEGDEIVVSETFTFWSNGEVLSLGWADIDDEGIVTPVPPPQRQDGGGSLNPLPLITELEIDLGGGDTETIFFYIDDTGMTWYLYRTAGEDDAPTLYLSPDEPLSRVSPAVMPVSIDIKPGSDRNPVNPGSKGVIAVGVLGSIDFDATQVDPTTVAFGPDEVSPAHDGHISDVDGDGFMDAVFHFETRETGIVCGDTEAALGGETFTGVPFSGTDSLHTVGCK